MLRRQPAGRLVAMIVVVSCLIGAVVAAGVRNRDRLGIGSGPSLINRVDYETWARKQFAGAHPGCKPLNWAIARAAVELYQAKPMGKFVLCVEPGEWGNDCSDFVACAIDEGLGLKARFNRDSREHILGGDTSICKSLYWRPGDAVQPGDVLSVRHSPWYTPNEGACWHVGIVGSDGKVYDFTKLKRWKRARYGRHELDWFVRHSRGPKQVIIRRLAARYRYLIDPLPAGEPAGAS